MSSSVLIFLQAQLVRYGMPTILILGGIGNIFNVIIFGQRRHNSCSMYLLCAALMNFVATTFGLSMAIYVFDHKEAANASLIICKSRFYLSHAWGQIARSFIVLACVDRYMMSSNVARFRVVSRPLIIRSIIGSVFIFWHMFPIHLLVLTTTHEGRCGQFGVYYIVYSIYFAIFVCLIPPVLMTICGFLAYRNMRRLHLRVQPIMNTTEGAPNNITIHRRDRDLLNMVLTEAIIYVILTVSYPFIYLESAITNYMGISKNTERLQIESFLSTLVTIFLYLNSAIPFYTYSIVSRTFRKDTKQLFTRWRRRLTGRVDIAMVPRISQHET